MSTQTTTTQSMIRTGWRPAAAVTLALAAISMSACAQAPAPQPETAQSAAQGETRPAEPIVELAVTKDAAQVTTPTPAPVAEAPAAPTAAPSATLQAVPVVAAQAEQASGPVVAAQAPVAPAAQAPVPLPVPAAAPAAQQVLGSAAALPAPVQYAADGRQVYEGTPVDGYVTAPVGLPEGMAYTPGFSLGETMDPVTGEYTGPGEAPAPIVVVPPAPKYPEAPVVVAEPAPVEQVQTPATEEHSADCTTYNGKPILTGWACPPAGLPEGMGYVPGFSLGETMDPVTGEYTGPGEAPALVIGQAPAPKYF